MGGTRPSPAFLAPWVPPGQAVSTPPGLPRPGSELGVHRSPRRPKPQLPRLCPPAQRRAAPLAPPARPVPAPRPRPRPLGPPRAAPRPRHHPRAGPEAPGFQAARRASPRLPQRPRLLLRLLPRLADAARHQHSQRRGIWETSAACKELRPERAPPSRPPVTSSPSCPPSAASSAPRPAPPARLRPPRRPEPGRGPPGAPREPRCPPPVGSSVWRPRGDAICGAYNRLSGANLSLGFVITVVLLPLSFCNRCYCYLH